MQSLVLTLNVTSLILWCLGARLPWKDDPRRRRKTTAAGISAYVHSCGVKRTGKGSERAQQSVLNRWQGHQKLPLVFVSTFKFFESDDNARRLPHPRSQGPLLSVVEEEEPRSPHAFPVMAHTCGENAPWDPRHLGRVPAFVTVSNGRPPAPTFSQLVIRGLLV